MTIWTGVAEGDRVLVACEKSGPLWGSVLDDQRCGTPSATYKVQYDDYPDEHRWVKNEEILRLHRGAVAALQSESSAGKE